MAHDVLIVDDEADIRMLIAGVLKDEGYATREAADTAQTLAAIQARQPTLVILDIWLQGGGLEGIEILKQLHVEMPSVPVVMISGHGTIETAVEAIKLGAYDFLEKPFKSDRLLLVVERAIEAAQLRRENEELRLRAGGDLDLVGISPAANQLRQQIERVAPTGSRVLITGPPGSARRLSGVSCMRAPGARKGPLFQSTARRCAPNGSKSSCSGPKLGSTARRVRSALRARAWRHVVPRRSRGHAARDAGQDRAGAAGADFREGRGSSRVEVDVRVVASSNRELGGEISAGRFREDLFYRLSVVPIRVPPLRDRREDIPLMARHFMARASEAARLTPREFGEDAMAALQAYTWPGNVRQLRNVIDWLLIMAPGDAREPVRADMLPNEITAIAPTVVKWDKGSEIMTLPLRDAREVFEREYLDRPGHPVWRQHLADRGLCRDGAVRPAPEVEILGCFRQ